MTDILAATVPIFMVVGLGYAVTRGGLFKREDMSILSTYVVKLALPMLIFLNVFGRSAEEIFNATYLLTYALTAVVMMGAAFAYARVMGRTALRAAFMGMGMSGTNNGFVGFPIFLIILPEVAGAAVGMDMLVDNIVIIPLTLLLAEQAVHAAGSAWRRVVTTVVGVVTHPMVVAIILALILNAVGFALPAIIERGVTLMAQTSSGVALFAVGGMLVGLEIRGMVSDIAFSVFGKLVLSPVAAFGVLAALVAVGFPALSNDLRAAAILTTALPTFSVLPAMAEKYGEQDLGAASMMLSVVLSFFTLTAWMWYLTTLGWL